MAKRLLNLADEKKAIDVESPDGELADEGGPSRQIKKPREDQHTIYGLSTFLYVADDLTGLLINKDSADKSSVDSSRFTHVLVLDQPLPSEDSQIEKISYRFLGLKDDDAIITGKSDDKDKVFVLWPFLKSWARAYREKKHSSLVICSTKGLSVPLYLCMHVLVHEFKLSLAQALVAAITVYPRFSPSSVMMANLAEGATDRALPGDLFVGEQSQYNKQKYDKNSVFVKDALDKLVDSNKFEFFPHPLSTSSGQKSKTPTPRKGPASRAKIPTSTPRSVPASVTSRPAPDRVITSITGLLSVTRDSEVLTKTNYISDSRLNIGHALLLGKPTPPADTQVKHVTYQGSDLPGSALEETLLEDVSSASNPELVRFRDFLYDWLRSTEAKDKTLRTGIVIYSEQITLAVFVCMQLFLSHYKLAFRQVFALALAARHDLVPTPQMLSKLRELAERVGVKTDGEYDIPHDLFVSVGEGRGQNHLRINFARYIRNTEFITDGLDALPEGIKQEMCIKPHILWA